MTSLMKKTNDFMKTRGLREFRLGANSVDSELNKLGETITPNKLDTRGVQELIRDNAGNFRGAVDYANREIRNMVRDAQRYSNQISTTTQVNRKEFQDELKRELIGKGITGFKTSNDRNLQLDNYVRMATQTTLKIARNMGIIEQCEARGIDLVKMSVHFPTCSICMPLQGRVFSISGKNKDYPSLYEYCFPGDYLTIHPNCKHSFFPYLPEYLTPEQVEADKEYSNRSFDVLNEQEKKMLDLYNHNQKVRAKANRDRKEYDAISLVLGKDIMPSFSGFRSSKRHNGKLYQDIKETYGDYLPKKEEVIESVTPINSGPVTTMLDNEALYKKIIDGNYFDDKEIAYLEDWRSLGKEDIVAKKLYNEKGFNAKPQLMDAEEFEKLDRNEYEIVFRGVANNNKEGITAYEINEQFKTGELYYGSGLYGGGTYTTGSKDMAIHYGADDVMVMAFRKDAKIVNFQEVDGFANETSSKRMYDYLSDVKHDNRTRAMTSQELLERKLLGNKDVLLSATNADIVRVTPSEWRAFFDYDKYQELYSQFGERINKDYYVILNRGAVIVRR